MSNKKQKKKVAISIRIDSIIYAEFKEICDKKRITYTTGIDIAIENYIAKEKKGDKIND